MRKKITLRSIVIIILFVVFGFNVVKQTMAIKRINNDIAKKSEQLNEKK